MNYFIKRAFFAALFSAAIAAPSLGESRPTTSNPNSFIVSGGAIPMSQSGAILLPQMVLQSMAQGGVSPMMQFVLANHVLNECIEKTIATYPRRFDTFPVSKVKFDNGFCQLGKCYQQAMMLAVLPSLSSNQNNGGYANTAEQNANKQMGAQLAQAFQKTSGCGGASDSGLDPMLLALLAGM